MGARLSQPRGPGGTGEASVPAKTGAPPSPRRPFPRTVNSRTIVAPAAALTMACILFVYTRTSISAAKANAQRHRQADSGGEGLSLLNEHRRRHGMAARLDEGGSTVGEVGRAVREQLVGARKKEPVEMVGKGISEEEERLRAMKGRVGRKSTQDEG
ncbi:hypothetical protein B0A54_00483 [Friedmanniomyces endolithicus]|uniref:Uncharacterized protein n=1 Tax=Friedmanniomyces endolithicus TaxID=329885 RepID=A0A4U0VH09_9PEZI|nr:hypothetical protein B0A54_00483 [Friedmanniomyces endolithicus]